MTQVGCKVCCQEITDLGCFGSCDLIPIPDLIAPVTGAYYFRFEIAGALRTVAVEFNAGDSIILPAELLNEDYLVEFKIFRPNGSAIGDECYQVLTLSEFRTVPIPRFIPTPPPPSENCDNMFQFNTVIGQTTYVIPPLPGGEELQDYSRFAIQYGAFNLPEVDYTVSPSETRWTIVGNVITFTFAPDQVVEVKIIAFV